MYVQQAENILHKCFEKFNKKIFEGKLPEAAVTIQTRGTKRAYGWCSTVHYWRNQDESKQLYEINISAEELNREPVAILTTLLHEMVHLHNVVMEIKDCSRNNRFHNKKFKETAEYFGMEFFGEADKRLGWCSPVMTESTKKIVESWGLDPKVFELYRCRPPRIKPKRPVYKLQCPGCETKIKAMKDGLSIRCEDCDQPFVYY